MDTEVRRSREERERRFQEELKRQWERDVPAEVRGTAALWAGSEDVCVLYVPYELGQSSVNRTRGKHWAVSHAATETAEKAAMWAYRLAGEPVNAEPVTVDALVFRGVQMDDDNVWGALKSVRDYLFKGRLAPDDTRRWVRQGELRMVVRSKWAAARAWVVLFVRRRGADDSVKRGDVWSPGDGCRQAG